MITVSHTESNLPFSVSCIGMEEGLYNFCVNIGEVNSFILQTYKSNSKYYDTDILDNEDFATSVEDQNKTNIDLKRLYSTPHRSGEFLYEFGDSWSKTCSGDASMQVYLTIPKIPAGFDVIQDTDGDFDKSKSWFLDKTDFLGQFSIKTSLDDNFLLDYQNNADYTEKNNTFRDPNYINSSEITRYKEFLSDTEYPGKIYIKLADITIENGNVSIKQFVKSNIVAPIRYFRTAGPSRLFKFHIEYCASQNNKLIDRSIFFNHPYFLTKPLDTIKSEAPAFYKSFFENFFSVYAQDVLYNFPEMEASYADSIGVNLAETIYKLLNFSIYRIIFIYKKSLGDEIIIENIFEDVNLFNSLKNSMGKANDPSSPDFVSDKSPMTEVEASLLFSDSEYSTIFNLINFVKPSSQ